MAIRTIAPTPSAYSYPLLIKNLNYATTNIAKTYYRYPLCPRHHLYHSFLLSFACLLQASNNSESTCPFQLGIHGEYALTPDVRAVSE